ncbi:hypothetical protein [Klebsiella pneumoniae]|uniref:hypothetical protein n=1 Tax=Klebsiella pneumoniae TaxID=573 RepID=UPI000CDFF9DA|nr:hypothetical protein [Klebsiella pneumoniae]HDS4924500.1 hypothetical protein [Klebsiella pneumoniae subsp. pneumoniae]AVB73460.1 hypothetical protein C3483_19805 [Klebsiella pneumoniae]MBM0441592.1 hypothetical protein [Klebsiella pneumoniae]MCM6453754.1 hypothetical protein [Klebsiella pneumoniae]MCM6488758.1 hypothetical protein [Klebsiella pneumoniae]
MTDITELAQRLKLEVHRAVSNFNPQMNIKTRDLKELVEALEKAQQHIAELESHTITVKMPKLKMLEDYLAEVAFEERKQILVGVKLEFHRALADAGIKVEAE